MSHLDLKIKNKLVFDGPVDQLFLKDGRLKRFEFTEEVAEIFDNMAVRSIPMYKEVHYSLIEWARTFFQEPAKIYDIGCSTGTAILSLSQNLDFPTKFVGVDLSKPMIEQARVKLQNIPKHHEVELKCENALDIEYSESMMTIVNYTLQFIQVPLRQALLRKIYEGLRPNGILFISEKVRSSSESFQELMTKSYEKFKFERGYTMNEIERKKEALDNVLIPYTLEEHFSLLKEVGFATYEILYKSNNFVTLVARKTL